VARVSIFLALERLDMPLASLIDVIHDPGFPPLTGARCPFAFPD
jgi:hypothetical protein